MTLNISIVKINGKLHKVVKETVPSYGGSYATYTRIIPLTKEEEIEYEGRSCCNESK